MPLFSEPLLDSERFVHSIKTALACMIGFAITKSVQLPVDQWLIITIVVVMCAQINVGSVLQKSYARFLGTLSGSLLAIITLLLFGANHIAVAITIGMSALIFSYIATSEAFFNDAGTLGAVTTIIILVGKNPTFFTAGMRFMEITVGIIVAALVSQFVLPIHARAHLRRNQAATIKQLRNYYVKTIMDIHPESETIIVQDLDESIVKSLIKQRALAKEAAREPLGAAYDKELFKKSLQCEKEILRCIFFMRRTYDMSPTSKELLLSDLPELQKFNKDVCQTLDNIATSLKTKQKITDTPNIPETKQIHQLLHSAAQKLADNETLYVDAWLFCAEALVKQLQKLVILLKHI